MFRILLQILLLTCFVMISSNFAQQKYYIYFKDKGIQSGQSLNKFSTDYQQVKESLSERSIKRRIKTMGESEFITYEDLPIRQDYIDSLIFFGIEIENKLSWFNSVTAYLDNSQKSSVLNLSFVDRIELVRTFKFIRRENNTQNYLPKIISTQDQVRYGFSFTQLALSDIPIVHSKGINGEGVIIGILDSGFKWNVIESLQNANVLAEYDFVFKDSVTSDQPEDKPGQQNHGTTVFSVIGGYRDSVIVGSAYGSTFILAKTEDLRSESHIEEDNYAAALIWMESLGVDVTTSSVGYNEFDDSVYSYKYSDLNGKTTIVTRAAELAFQRGITVINSAGNEGDKSWYHIIAPADGFNTIAVGAVNKNNQVAGFSSRGPSSDGRIKPDVVAQGVDVYGASSGGFSLYSYYDGTSFAAPIAAGVAALLLSANPHLTNSQVRNIIIETADNSSSPNNERGYGLISASDALSFPNVHFSNDKYTLHKMFLIDGGIISNTVRLNYTLDGGDYSSQEMNFDGSNKFTTILPQLPDGQTLDFFFTFSDSLANNVREPGGNSTYKLKYGDLNIYHNLSIPIPYDYGILSQNYPNPFNNKTTIKFQSSSVENAEIIILDAIGQKVRTLFNGLTKIGENSVQWDGSTDSGIYASSGVYFYILKITGKEYGKKMILLK